MPDRLQKESRRAVDSPRSARFQCTQPCTQNRRIAVFSRFYGLYRLCQINNMRVFNSSGEDKSPSPHQIKSRRIALIRRLLSFFANFRSSLI